MSLEELSFEVDSLTHRLEERAKSHKRAMDALRREMSELRTQLEAAKPGLPSRDRPTRDDSFVHSVEWRIADFASLYERMSKNEAMHSDAFTVAGTEMHLEFFPRGRDSTKIPGFCALFLWCPKGVRLRYQLRVGQYRVAPDVDEYQAKMGHGHSNFCNALSQCEKDNTLTVGVEIIELRSIREIDTSLSVINPGLRSLVEHEAAVVLNRHMNRVEWRIKNIRKFRDTVPSGTALCSRPFSLAGLRNMLLEFYPNSVNSDAAGAGYCGLYINCAAGTSLKLSFFVGSTKRGPIQTMFDGHNAKGLPKFCKLNDELGNDVTDIVVGVELDNPTLAEEEEKKTIDLEDL